MAEWGRQTVESYGAMLEKAFGVSVSGQCRSNSVRPPGGAANSLHYQRNDCRALDLTGTDKQLLALEAWAKQTGAFAEVIYSGETSYHRTGGANNHLHLGFPRQGDVPEPGGRGWLDTILNPVDSARDAVAGAFGSALESMIGPTRDLAVKFAILAGGVTIVALGAYRAVSSNRRT